MRITTTKIALFLVVLLLFTGCENPFSPPSYESPQTNEIYSPTQPDNVLRNLELSYKKKDLELFKSCLADSFRFELVSEDISDIGVDMNNDGINDEWWGYQEEVEYHRNMFLEGSSDGEYSPPDDITLNLTIPNEEDWELDSSSNHEGWIIIPCYFDLQISYFDEVNHNAEGFVWFHLKPIEDYWKISIWQEGE